MNQTAAYIRDTLKEMYSPEEIRNLSRWIFERVCGLTFTQQILCKDKKIPENEKAEIRAIVQRLARSEPLQYVFGECEFHGLRFEVNASVLIPRPETSELVERILSRHAETDIRVLDIGVGSGCIAVSLAKKMNGAKVAAIDVSDDALATARRNARYHRVDISFLQADVFSERLVRDVFFSSKFDVIVSNPPYITESEKVSMEANVLAYEPAQALFVPDDDPLRFYRRIAECGREWLSEGGCLYFEINPLYVLSLARLLEEMDYRNVEIIRDISGKERFIQCAKP